MEQGESMHKFVQALGGLERVVDHPRKEHLRIDLYVHKFVCLCQCFTKQKRTKSDSASGILNRNSESSPERRTRARIGQINMAIR